MVDIDNTQTSLYHQVVDPDGAVVRSGIDIDSYGEVLRYNFHISLVSPHFPRYDVDCNNVGCHTRQS